MGVVILSANVPTKLLDANTKRTKVKFQFQSTSADINNTGLVFAGFGFQPVATAGHNAQGDILAAGDAIEEPQAGGVIDEHYKQALWVTADTASQSVTVQEEVESTG